MNYLLDTCFVSELVRPSPTPSVLLWLENQDEKHLHISVVTLGEIQAGISKLAESRRKVELTGWLNQELPKRFQARVLAVDLDTALIWGTKRGEAAAAGLTLPLADSLIAATALSRGMTVVTRNTTDLQRCGAMTLNPWQ